LYFAVDDAAADVEVVDVVVPLLPQLETTSARAAAMSIASDFRTATSFRLYAPPTVLRPT